ncbi:hypothetical protein A2334_03245 [Candidatus Roizmanbacteria bacterium RIFOXYB2_FULL_38_10]|uniref:Methyltransferase domain-containing protein n=1 Tax=Candidatus Roizmanbacteria bacterium RIFOXYD1_FULL_38_12 TaxID=1802093 RepID=A0A1F7L163_9BACT|nr:MAG: hypothetical protein A3K47_03605 [Candidatus Roizmanbacteria bacterium RIFOXYA2_FULL_38_14]OGK63848.1 MAG: hypothetical protein A3K27_03605 [Candidatus Roizmanbacteria bacterium RIFOXYA1_FULL_37_12]OGK65694.1 MAG: hypothetical protein A3K38_03605 [Candidatus Roizmanbacteria bacterium RIFOXYB1_FULL_40_23]OGK67419.1 MAG: hypothetical protein A2334_03245 [Candidatus Roizmanbacteria bacterium RIFOXYB2_FULL_38_10]OGK70099.1 MAG: hypothetical protein A3K21_03610 [Candidatus Roizmanbacteria ba
MIILQYLFFRTQKKPMMRVDPKQRAFFNVKQNQYDETLLLHPKRHVREELEIIKKKLGGIKEEIVDFGAGVGRVTIPLIQKKYKITAVDISKQSLKTLVLFAKNIHKSVYLKTAVDLTKQKNKKAIIGADVLHHVDIASYLPDFYDSLSKDGRIIFSEPNAWHIFWFIHILIGGNWEVEKGILQCSYFNLISKLKRYGFKDIKLSGFGLFPPPLFNRIYLLSKLNYFLGDLPFFKLFAFRFIIEAYK